MPRPKASRGPDRWQEKDDGGGRHMVRRTPDQVATIVRHPARASLRTAVAVAAGFGLHTDAFEQNRREIALAGIGQDNHDGLSG